MFRQAIHSNILTSEIANDYFSNIKGSTFNGDQSFVTTLRALVAPRMKEGESIEFQYTRSDYSGDSINGVSVSTALGAINSSSRALTRNGVIEVHNFEHRIHDDNLANIELVKKSFESTYAGWHLVPKVTDFFRKTFYAICFINPDTKSTILYAEDLNIAKMHYLQCGIFAFLPWYFDPSAGVSALEMELINSLREKKPDKYEECIAKIASQYDFRAQRLKKLLGDFESRYERRMCDEAAEEVTRIINEIDRKNRDIGNLLSKKHEQEIKLLGLRAKIAADSSNGSEIMNYFLCNKRLSLDSVSATSMVFSCWGYAEYYDEDMARTMIENRNSYIYKPEGRGSCGDIIDADDMERLMTAIFIEEILKIRLCSVYNFNLNGCVEAIRFYDYGSEFDTCMPNTHIDRYACLGNYQRTINSLLKENNYIGAIEQCMASCQSLNFGDSAVMDEFMDNFYEISAHQRNIRCIELPDGTVVKPKEAIKWLKEYDAAEQQGEVIEYEEEEREEEKDE